MPLPLLEEIRSDVLQAESDVTVVASKYGKNSPQYKDALKRFARVWFVLRMTREKNEFLHDITRN